LPEARGERRLVWLVGAVAFVDTMFLAAIAPLLPGLAHELHLSKASAGLLTASYALGMIAGSLPGGMIVIRAGSRATVCAGLALMAGSTLAFALGQSAPVLVAARLVEGVGGAFSWAGGIAWIVAGSGPERRGRLMGVTMGAGVAGAVSGPVLGAVASAVGRPSAFIAVILVALGLIALAVGTADARSDSGQGALHLLRALRSGPVRLGSLLMIVPAVASGLLTVLAPLRLHQLGAGAGGIAAIFLLATALEAAVTPWVGRISDRRGRLAAAPFGLAWIGLLLLLFIVPGSVAGLGLLVVGVSVGAAAFWAPVMALLSEAAEAVQLDQALAAALMNITWAVGQVIGAAGGGALARSAGDGAPTAGVAALCLVVLVPLARHLCTMRKTRPVAPSPEG
jgi:predicted MFS family arabinose efflux permease